MGPCSNSKLVATQSYSLAEDNVKGQDIIAFVSHKTVMMILWLFGFTVSFISAVWQSYHSSLLENCKWCRDLYNYTWFLLLLELSTEKRLLSISAFGKLRWADTTWIRVYFGLDQVPSSYLHVAARVWWQHLQYHFSSDRCRDSHLHPHTDSDWETGGRVSVHCVQHQNTFREYQNPNSW